MGGSKNRGGPNPFKSRAASISPIVGSPRVSPQHHHPPPTLLSSLLLCTSLEAASMCTSCYAVAKCWFDCTRLCSGHAACGLSLWPSHAVLVVLSQLQRKTRSRWIHLSISRAEPIADLSSSRGLLFSNPILVVSQRFRLLLLLKIEHLQKVSRGGFRKRSIIYNLSKVHLLSTIHQPSLITNFQKSFYLRLISSNY